jgi:thiamine biosynthesis protein ThiC
LLCAAVIGRHFRTKINANIGNSAVSSSIEEVRDRVEVVCTRQMQ